MESDAQINALFQELDLACEELENTMVKSFYGIESEAESIFHTFAVHNEPEGEKDTNNINRKDSLQNSWYTTGKTKPSIKDNSKRKSFMGASEVRTVSASSSPSPLKRNTIATRAKPIESKQKRDTWCITQSMTSGTVPEKPSYDKKKTKIKLEEKPKQLGLTILSGVNLPRLSVISPYVIGFFDPEISFRTRTAFNTLEPIWNEPFEILYPEIGDLHLSLWNNVSPKKQVLLGFGKVAFNKNSPCEDTVNVLIEHLEDSESKLPVVPCSATVQIKYNIFEVDTKGDHLIELLVNERKLMVEIYQWIEENKSEIAASALIELFHSRKRAKNLISDIIRHPRSITGLRTKNSVLRKMIALFCRYSRDSYMNILQPLLIQMEDNKIQLEVRPTYLQQQIRKTSKELKKRQTKNKETLMHYAKQFIEVIKTTAHDLILDLRSLCKQISERFKDEPETVRELLGDILFQKYLCPMIASPVAFGLVRSKEPGSAQTQSNIVLAKLLVAMATNKPFPSSNELSCMNEFISTNYQLFDEIYKIVSGEQSTFQQLLCNTKQREDFRKHLETRFCTENLEFWEDIQEYHLLHDESDRQGFAAVIWKLYFNDGAERQLNVDVKVVSSIKEKLAEAPVDLFDGALDQVTQLLKTDSFHKYRTNRKATVGSGQQIRQKVRVKCLAETCNFLVCNLGALKQFVGNDDTELCEAMKNLDEVLGSLAMEYNPHRDDVAYRLLNRERKWQKLPRAAWTVAASLLNTIKELYEKYFASTGSFTDELIKELAASKEFAQFANDTSELQAVKVHSLSNNQKFAFWINTFNLLTLHAYICVGQPNSKKTWLALQAYSGYEIDGKVYTLLEIEHCVLRGGMGVGKWIGTTNTIVKPFEPNDERYRCICTKPLPQLYFLLCNGINSQPVLHVFSPGSLQKDIETAAQLFLQSNVSMEFIALKELHVPKIFKWICKDMGMEKRKSLRNFVSSWEDTVPQKQHIITAAKSHAFKIISDPPVWQFLPMFG